MSPRVLDRPTAAARQALSLWAPPACPACGRSSDRRALELVCPVCRPSLRRHPHCLRCGRRLPPSPALRLHPVETCRICRRLRPHFNVAQAVAPYTGPWRDAVIAYKQHPYGERLEQMAGLLRRLVLNGRPAGPWSAVVAVPTHRNKSSHPGTRLAERLAARLQYPCLSPLRFVRSTVPQRTLTRSRRLRNLRGALRACGAGIRGASLLVVDDVFTTGATASECARALKRAGAVRVGVLTLARGLDRNGRSDL